MTDTDPMPTQEQVDQDIWHRYGTGCTTLAEAHAKKANADAHRAQWLRFGDRHQECCKRDSIDAIEHDHADAMPAGICMRCGHVVALRAEGKVAEHDSYAADDGLPAPEFKHCPGVGQWPATDHGDEVIPAGTRAELTAFLAVRANRETDAVDDRRIEQQVAIGGRHAGCPAGPGHDMHACDRAAAVAVDASGTWMTAVSEPVDPYRRQPCGHQQMMRAHHNGACQRCAGNVPADMLDDRGGLKGVNVLSPDQAARFTADYIAAELPVPPFVYAGGGVAVYPPAIGTPRVRTAS